MGCDLSAALGVAVATGRRTYCIAGDGNIMANIQELQTLSARGSDVVVFLLNNDGYNSIRQTQQNYFPENLSGCGPDRGLDFPRYEAVAGAFGFTYQRIDLNGDVSSALNLVLNSRDRLFVKSCSTRNRTSRPSSLPKNSLTAQWLQVISPTCGPSRPPMNCSRTLSKTKTTQPQD